MSKDQGYGLAIFLLSVCVFIGYLAAFFAPLLGFPVYWRDWAVGIPVLLFVVLVLAISGWIGWTMLRTSAAVPLETEISPSTPKPNEGKQ